jgi:hypothetical protein
MVLVSASLTTAQLQAWIGIIGGLATAIFGLLKYFDFRSRRESLTAVGHAFAAVVDALASKDAARRASGAILLRRFFDRRTEQGERHAPYAQEAVGVIAALLRDAEADNFQKLLADGLGYAPSLTHADLQRCNLQNAYLGVRPGRAIDLSGADFFEADLTHASLRGARAQAAVFYRAILCDAVLSGCDLTKADFRGAYLAGARFDDATIVGARFEGAHDVPAAIAALLDADGHVPLPVESR